MNYCLGQDRIALPQSQDAVQRAIGHIEGHRTHWIHGQMQLPPPPPAHAHPTPHTAHKTTTTTPATLPLPPGVAPAAAPPRWAAPRAWGPAAPAPALPSGPRSCRQRGVGLGVGNVGRGWHLTWVGRARGWVGVDWSVRRCVRRRVGGSWAVVVLCAGLPLVQLYASPPAKERSKQPWLRRLVSTRQPKQHRAECSAQPVEQCTTCSAGKLAAVDSQPCLGWNLQHTPKP